MTNPDCKQKGKAYLVGAGPGDPGLLTLRGKECLEQADVVLYDNLANPQLLRFAPKTAERIYVGRCGRETYVHQDTINAMILQNVRKGKKVVRLKGGDPFVFGRGGEEAEVMAEAGLSFEIVPGVTSAVAVPAYAGIPVTHRTLASVVTFVTGHEDPTKGSTALEWPRLASADGTLVFLMGMKNLSAIVERLLNEGKSPDTPAAIIRWGTYPRQKTVIGTLRTIVHQAQAEQMEPPTVIVVGRVIDLRNRLNWFETRPLFGKRILVTRATNQADVLSQLLMAYGGEPVEFPTIDIVPPDSWDEVDRAIRDFPEYQWVVFTSVNGVQWFFPRLYHQDLDARAFHGKRLCCIGPRTAEEVQKFGVKADVIPAEFQAEGLLESMKAVGVAGQRILIPRASEAREILPEELRRLGATVDVVRVYKTVKPDSDPEPLKEQLRKGLIHIITFASSSTVRNFCRVFDSKKELYELLNDKILACIGPITAQTVEELGLKVGVVAEQNTIPALVDSLIKTIQSVK